MSVKDTTEIRELTDAELEVVVGGGKAGLAAYSVLYGAYGVAIALIVGEAGALKPLTARI